MTIQRVGCVALVLSLLTGSALAEEPAGAPAEAIAPIDACVPAAEGSAWARWSLSHLGLFWDFDGRVKRAFPVGSCEKDLREWLAEEGFSEIRNMTLAGFDGKYCRLNAREDDTLYMSDAVNLSICGYSIYMICWTSDRGTVTGIKLRTDMCNMQFFP